MYKLGLEPYNRVYLQDAQIVVVTEILAINKNQKYEFTYNVEA